MWYCVNRHSDPDVLMRCSVISKGQNVLGIYFPEIPKIVRGGGSSRMGIYGMGKVKSVYQWKLFFLIGCTFWWKCRWWLALLSHKCSHTVLRLLINLGWQTGISGLERMWEKSHGLMQVPGGIAENCKTSFRIINVPCKLAKLRSG
jgi:hypothetical protein